MPDLATTPSTFETAASPPLARGRGLARWRHAWNRSLRFRLLALGLMPLLVAFPLLIGALAGIGGHRADTLLDSNLRSTLTGTRNYLEQLRKDAAVRVGQLVKTERLVQLVNGGDSRRELDQLLATAARSSGFDYLLVATADGRILGSSNTVAPGARLPESFATRQAFIGVTTATFERFEGEQLAVFAPSFPAQARIEVHPRPPVGPLAETRGLLIHAAAHFPLAVDAPDAVLVGGILTNRNFALIEHLRELIYPVGSLPDDAEGMTALYLDRVSIAASRQRLQGERRIGLAAPPEVAHAVLTQRQAWVGTLVVGGAAHRVGFDPLADGEGRVIGMVSAGFPEGPYQRMTWMLIGTAGLLLAATMLAISWLFIRTGRELTQRLARMAVTMNAVRAGHREARVGTPARDDELGRLARHFDTLLETIAAQDAAQAAAQRAIADEVSQRRALFENARDGVVVLDTQGRVLEANPKAAQMLGCSVDELLQREAFDWDARFTPAEFRGLLGDVGAEGRLFETRHRRRDGSLYEAEVSLSAARWGDRTFVFLLQRDITRRKTVEAELARHRRELEHLVEQRTRDLQERTGQLDAIFALSPDGFVSFDAQRRVRVVNQAFERMTGLSADGLVGTDEADFSARLQALSSGGAGFPGIAALRAARERLEAGEGGEATEHGRQSFVIDGPPARVLEVGLRRSAGGSVSQVLYVRDVTHETEVDRMKSEFLTTAAHELRTPMTSIYGFVNLLRAREMGADKRRDILDTIARQSELMVNIVNQLLDLARIESRRGSDFVLERLSLRDLAVATAHDYQPPGGRAAPVLGDIDDALPVRADAQKIQQALLNIVSNAYKYSPAGGAVHIGFLLDESGGHRRVGVSVRDHGIGMTPQQVAHVFERFYRADASGTIPGTGLGMSIVKEIVELHGGQVDIASAPGEGTTMTLWLPAAA